MRCAKQQNFGRRRMTYTATDEIAVATKQIAKLVLSQRDLGVDSADKV